jgi:sulfatase modifying factor 1
MTVAFVEHVHIPSVGPSCLLAAVLVTQLPRVTSAHAQQARAVDPWPRTSPATSALTGQVVRLQAPGAQMIRIPASTTLLGSTELEVLEAASACPHRVTDGNEPLNTCGEAWFAQELPRHPVSLDSYWIDRTEVTVAAYRRCVELRRCRPVPFSEGARRFDRSTHPVSLVTQEEARRFCAYRGARLPTEAEFERAARGLAGSIYPWGDTFHRGAANHGRVGWDSTDDRDGYAEQAPVGSFPAGRTPAGVLDLAGNVAEWVSDYFAPYAAGQQTNPRGPASPLGGGTSFRVVRGGGYRDAPPQLRGAARQIAEATTRSTTIGFRCARTTASARQPTPEPSPRVVPDPPRESPPQ